MHACAIDLRTLCKELREKCVNSGFSHTGALFEAGRPCAPHIKDSLVKRERLINKLMQRARQQQNYSIAGFKWTHIRLSHSLTHKHFIEKLCQQNTDIENCLDIAMHQKTKFLAKTENSGLNWAEN